MKRLEYPKLPTGFTALFIGWFLFVAAVMIGVGFVVVHFISKFW